jgi:class 3 adenylate cyclase
MSRSTHYDRLLGLLDQAAGHDGLHPRDRSTREAAAALEAEALIERTRGGYRITAAGWRALEDRGRRCRPSGEVAVMFTDMEGSTQLIERLGETEAHALLRRHFLLLRAAIADHRGHEVKSLGDGLMVVFAEVTDAVACAAEMHVSVSGEPEAVGLRVGIHVGEPTCEGDDYFGRPVIIARRLCDTAGAGQTLVSEAASQRVSGREFKSLGGLALKGLSERIRASALTTDGCDARGDLSSPAVAV